MNEFLSSINDQKLQADLLPMKIAFIVTGFIFLAFLVWAVLRTQWKNFRFIFDLTEFLSYRAYGYSRVTRQWERIKSRLQTPNEAEYKLALMEADDILGNILLRIGFTQLTLAERLKNVTEAIIPNIQEVAQAHAVRNNIVHDPDYHLTLEQARKTLGVYEDAFRALDLI
ncbi:MAG: hypothetical protein HY458_00030 [Parcubacteria group bacterium]|nr:hypothetical protein [Parcubacteria group bacterium]